MEENEFWVKIWGIIVTGVVIMAVVAMTWNGVLQKRYVENGYCQVTLQGHSGVSWTKCK